jgi:hypothetical protein
MKRIFFWIFVLVSFISLLIFSGFSHAETTDIIITQPSSSSDVGDSIQVPVGQSIQLTASAPSGPEQDFYWMRSGTFEEEWPFKVSDNGLVTGLNLGKGTLTILGSTGVTRRIEVVTISGEETTITLDLNKTSLVDLDPDNNVKLQCKVWNVPPENCELYVAVLIDEVLYFFPTLDTTLVSYKKDVQAKIYTVFEIPFQYVPINDYMFLAAVFDENMNMKSNLSYVKLSGGHEHNE